MSKETCHKLSVVFCLCLMKWKDVPSSVSRSIVYRLGPRAISCNKCKNDSVICVIENKRDGMPTLDFLDEVRNNVSLLLLCLYSCTNLLEKV